jgi:hypothetical protein
VLDSIEALFFDRGHDTAVSDQSGCRIAVVGIYSEDQHVEVISVWLLAPAYRLLPSAFS